MTGPLRQWLAQGCMGLSLWMGHSLDTPWLRAMVAEFAAIEDEGEELSFALGVLWTVFILRLRAPRSRQLFGGLTALGAMAWALVKVYFTTIVLWPQLGINLFVSPTPTFQATDLLHPWHFGLIYLSAVAYLAVSALILTSRGEAALNLTIALGGVSILACIITLALGGPTSTHSVVLLNLSALECTLLLPISLGARATIPQQTTDPSTFTG